MATNQVEAFLDASKGSDNEKANLEYSRYVASMEAAGQRPKSRKELLG